MAIPNRAHILAFAVGGAVAGFGAAIFAAYFGGANAQYGLRSGLAAMTAAVLGGVGDPRGALLGGVVLGIVASFSDYLLDAEWTPVLVLVLLIGLLAFRPSGLLGTNAGSSPSRGRPRDRCWPCRVRRAAREVGARRAAVGRRGLPVAGPGRRLVPTAGRHPGAADGHAGGGTDRRRRVCRVCSTWATRLSSPSAATPRRS